MDWTKPNGRKITTNDFEDTVAYAESLGWKRVDGVSPLGATLLKNEVNLLEDKNQIALLVFSETGKKLDMRGGIDIVRAKAINMLEAA